MFSIPQNIEPMHPRETDCFSIPFFSWLLEHLSFNQLTTSSWYNGNDKTKRDVCDSFVQSESYDALDITLTEQDDSFAYDEHDGIAEKAKVHQLSDFDRHRILGAGQFGQVWLVTDKSSLPKTVFALKVMSKYDLVSSNEVPSVFREKEIMQQLQGHPFIAQLHASFQSENLLFLLQEFCQGGELFSLMHTSSNPHRSLTESQAAFYALGIADALEFMHIQHHIAYRDLKPENILLDAEGYPKLIDMGYAKVLSADHDFVSTTFCGTPRYVAPEMILSVGSSFDVDHWALGILLYEMIFGCNPFFTEGMDQMELFECICQVELDIAPNVCSKDMVNLIGGLLAKDPCQRLGRSVAGGESICEHSSLHHFDLATLRKKQTPAPWIPNIRNSLDTDSFDDWTDKLDDITIQTFPKLTKREAAMFVTF
jgi:serine/threonine protein kinase